MFVMADVSAGCGDSADSGGGDRAAAISCLRRTPRDEGRAGGGAAMKGLSALTRRDEGGREGRCEEAWEHGREEGSSVPETLLSAGSPPEAALDACRG